MTVNDPKTISAGYVNASCDSIKPYQIQRYFIRTVYAQIHTWRRGNSSKSRCQCSVYLTIFSGRWLC